MKLLAFFGFIFALCGCGSGVPEVPPDQSVSYAQHLESLITKRCVGCHALDEPEAKLVLEHGQGYGQLVGRQSVQVPAMPLVEPGDSDASYLWHKLNHRAAKGKGMPRTLTGSKRLPDEELPLIRRWIDDGAVP